MTQDELNEQVQQARADSCCKGPEDKVAKLEEEIKEHEKKYLLLLAEMENSRKRMQREKVEMNRFAVENVIADFLTPIDQMEKALGFTENMSPEVKNWAIGFQMILGQFKEVLTQNGVTAYQSEGEVFNPHKHEAMETEETTEHKDGTILKEFVKGYQSGDRVIRVARVKIAKAPAVAKPEQPIIDEMEVPQMQPDESF